MAAITICSDFGSRKIKSATVSTISPSICHEVMGPDAIILVFWMLSFKPTFSLSSFTFVKRLFSSSSLYLVLLNVICSLHNWYWRVGLVSSQKIFRDKTKRSKKQSEDLLSNRKVSGSSLVAQTVKCLHAIWETWVRSLGTEDPLEKETAIHSNTLALNPMNRGSW